MKNIIFFWCMIFLVNFGSHAENFDFDISQYKDKVVYLDFWASWCIPCRHSFPWMNAMHQKYASKGLVILAVNLDEDKSASDAFLKKYAAKFKVVFDSGQLAERFQVTGMPYAVIFDKDGEIASTHIGFKAKNANNVATEIQNLLERK